MNAKIVAVVIVAMVALASGQYDRYSGSRWNRWGSRGLGGSWDRLSLGSRGLGLGNSWGLGGGSLGHHGRYSKFLCYCESFVLIKPRCSF